jgi:hypothetical protein
MLDPFVKSHGIEENDNSGIDNVAQMLTDLAVKYDIAVDAPHHISKGGPADPGNADRGRGASALADALRLVYTLTAMSQEEAEGFNIPDDQRREYVRLDRAKLNIAKTGGPPMWFHLVGKKLNNATALYPSGDEVQTVEPWKPPDTWGGLQIDTLNTVLTAINAGVLGENGPTGQRFSSASSAGEDRAAWRMVQRFCPEKSEAQCREIIRTWEESGVLVTREYDDPRQRKKVGGLFVDDAKRPGTKTRVD